MTERMVRDAGIEPMLKSWMVIDNHDIPRIANQFPDHRSAAHGADAAVHAARRAQYLLRR
jgi:hypothetical protein